jgi:hypothetical protein
MFIVWQKDEKTVAIMDVTKVVDDAHRLKPELSRFLFANALLDLTEADFVMTADNEEQLIEMFPNAIIKYEDKEVH